MSTTRCHACGESLYFEARFCSACGTNVRAATGPGFSTRRGSPSEGKSAAQIWMGRIGRLLSIRIWIGSLFGCLIISVILGMIWEPLTWTFFVLWPASLFAWFFADDQELTCPWCRKLVKLGATTCHHCGRVVAASARTETPP